MRSLVQKIAQDRADETAVSIEPLNTETTTV